MMNYGVVNKASVWLYEDMGDTVSDELLMGWAVCILEWKNGYYKVVTHYGYVGYLEETAIESVHIQVLINREREERIRVIIGAMVDVVETPKVQGKIICTLSRGAFVFNLPTEEAAKRNGYEKVLLANGRNGYVPKIFCEKRMDTDRFLWATPGKKMCFCEQKLPEEEAVFRERVVHIAKSFLGTQYRWAGKSAAGIDCSGLVCMSYMLSGILIYRDAKIRNGYPIKEIPIETMKKGDLLYFPSHVAMYIGDGKYIHATGHINSFGCVINSLNPEEEDYRADLASAIYAVGSLWQLV